MPAKSSGPPLDELRVNEHDNSRQVPPPIPPKVKCQTSDQAHVPWSPVANNPLAPPVSTGVLSGESFQLDDHPPPPLPPRRSTFQPVSATSTYQPQTVTSAANARLPTSHQSFQGNVWSPVQPFSPIQTLQSQLHSLQTSPTSPPPALNASQTWPIAPQMQALLVPTAYPPQIPVAYAAMTDPLAVHHVNTPFASSNGNTPISSPTQVLPGGFSHAPTPPPPSMYSSHDIYTLPDMSRLNISQQSHSSQLTSSTLSTQGHAQHESRVSTPRLRARHDCACAGCGADPIRGEFRWHCQNGKDEHLCQHCKDAGVKKPHSIRPLQPWTEQHLGYNCDGCDSMPIYGPRFRCLTHRDEDWCESCHSSGRCCGGPFREVRQTPLGIYMEQRGGVPMPEQWHHYLMGPVIATYHMGCEDHPDGWLSREGWREFYRKPFRDMAMSGWEKPAYGYEAVDEHHKFSDDKYYWSFRSNPKHEDKDKRKKIWDYLLKVDNATGIVTAEEFALHKSNQTIPGRAPQFRHGPEVDSLVFTSPDGRRQFRWLTNKPVSTLNGERWDSQLYALFERVEGAAGCGLQTPGGSAQNERIVADMAWWDGHHDAPETAINLRDPGLDHSLVLATLAVLLDHQWRVLRAEKARHPHDVRRAESQARLTYLGRQAYWKKGDAVVKTTKGGGGTGPRAASTKAAAAKVGLATASLEVAANVLELANHVM